MNIRAEIQRFAHELAEQDNAAFDLWTWLPSYAAAQKHHGDHYHNHTPPVSDILREAAIYLGDLKHPSPDGEPNEFYDCPCGEPHEEEAP